MDLWRFVRFIQRPPEPIPTSLHTGITVINFRDAVATANHRGSFCNMVRSSRRAPILSHVDMLLGRAMIELGLLIKRLIDRMSDTT